MNRALPPRKLYCVVPGCPWDVSTGGPCPKHFPACRAALIAIERYPNPEVTDGSRGEVPAEHR